MASSYFSLKVFFILLRETFESAIVISILLSFLKQNFTKKAVQSEESVLTIERKQYRMLQFQVWIGGALGLFICLCIGSVFVALFYLIGENYWTRYERVWEASFSVLSSLIISIMGLSLLRINQMQRKWHAKLSKQMSKQIEQQQLNTIEANEDEILENELGVNFNRDTAVGGPRVRAPWKKRVALFMEKNSLMILPMVTLLREGLEAIFVISGVSASEPVESLPLSILLALGLGSLIGVTLYKGGNKMKLQMFLIGSTCFLYLVSAGLMSRGVWFYEYEIFVQRCNGQDMAEVGNGPGSYDIANTIWHVNCCSGINDGGYMLLNALLGWQNTATYGSVISYNLYWVLIILLLQIKLFQERNGYIPLIPIKWQLRKIQKRFKIIKFNLENNVNYKRSDRVVYDSVGENAVELYANEFESNDEDEADDVVNDSQQTTSLLASSRGTNSRD